MAYMAAMTVVEDIRAALATGRRTPLSMVSGITEERAEELVGAIRADRDRSPSGAVDGDRTRIISLEG